MTTSQHIQFASSWRPGGAVAFTEFDPETGADIWMMDPLRPDSARAFLRTQANEFGAVFSLDGKWVAYASDESGQNQVYAAHPPPRDRELVQRAGRAHGRQTVASFAPAVHFAGQP